MTRQPYEPCKAHGRTYCSESVCKREETASGSSNAGSVSVNTDGGISIGIGSGLAIDPSDGSVGFQVGGVTIDTY